MNVSDEHLRILQGVAKDFQRAAKGNRTRARTDRRQAEKFPARADNLLREAEYHENTAKRWDAKYDALVTVVPQILSYKPGLAQQPRAGNDSPYTQGYWDADNLLRLNTGSDYGLSQVFVEFLMGFVSSAGAAAPAEDPDLSYEAGARARLYEEFDNQGDGDAPSLTSAVVEDADAAAS